MAHAETAGSYYVPHGTHWPILGSIGLTLFVAGIANMLNGHESAWMITGLGTAVLIFMMWGWFGDQIRENQQGLHSEQVERSYRWGMFWFIFSEVMFFAAFFGALFYARQFSLPWLGGDGIGVETNAVLWPSFENVWPTNGPGELGGRFDPMHWWPLPTINTLILLTSGVTVTFAHHAIKEGHYKQVFWWLAATVGLGFLFVGLQAFEYYEAYAHLNLTMGTGIYGSTFFMLTGFHGMHVTIGAIMLTVMMFRALKQHHTPENHFAFEAAAWYWHFVDVVWLGLYIFVYWI